VKDHPAVFEVVDLHLPRDRDPVQPPAGEPWDMGTGRRGNRVIGRMRGPRRLKMDVSLPWNRSARVALSRDNRCDPQPDEAHDP
jgi:hypothetical protein